MSKLTAYQGSIWLADGERFAPFITRAMAQPCPTAKDVGKMHRRAMKAAGEILPGNEPRGPLCVYGFDAGGKDCDIEDWNLSVGDEPLIGNDGKQLSIKAEAPRAIRAVKGKIGVIPIYGPVDQRMTGELAKSGGTPLDFVSAALDALLANPSVGAIVLRFDSPGGSVSGVQELADKIYEARAEKPIYAIADSLAASAALWLASAATMLISTPGGGGATVGSVGVYVMHVDESAALEKDGIKVTMVSAGKYKTEFAPHAPMSDEARGHAQARVDGIHEQFMGALKRNRGTTLDNVRQNYGQGRVLTAQQALSVGMIDRVMSFSELISKLAGSGTPAPSGPSAAKLLALHEYEEEEDGAEVTSPWVNLAKYDRVTNQ